jgi:hypothetical protein
MKVAANTLAKDVLWDDMSKSVKLYYMGDKSAEINLHKGTLEKQMIS